MGTWTRRLRLGVKCQAKRGEGEPGRARAGEGVSLARQARPAARAPRTSLASVSRASTARAPGSPGKPAYMGQCEISIAVKLAHVDGISTSIEHTFSVRGQRASCACSARARTKPTSCARDHPRSATYPSAPRHLSAHEKQPCPSLEGGPEERGNPAMGLALHNGAARAGA